MKTVYVWAMALVAAAVGCQEQKELTITQQWGITENDAPNTLSESEKKAGWQLLFDGKSFAGWHGYNLGNTVPDCWAVEDGTLTMNTEGSGESQDIVTDKEYSSYALYLEYKMTPACNSGIIFQVKEDTLYQYPYETGPEMQVLDNEGWAAHNLKESQLNGGNYEMYVACCNPVKPIGEWNSVLLLVEGNKITQVLNDTVVVEYEKWSDDWAQRRGAGKWAEYTDWGKFDQGHIALQNHGTKVWYRNIKIKALK